jgi:predicted exporter
VLTEILAFVIIVAGVGAIVNGVSTALPSWREGQWQSMDLSLATLAIIGGFGLIGLAQILRFLLAINGKI